MVSNLMNESAKGDGNFDLGGELDKLLLEARKAGMDAHDVLKVLQDSALEFAHSHNLDKEIVEELLQEAVNDRARNGNVEHVQDYSQY